MKLHLSHFPFVFHNPGARLEGLLGHDDTFLSKGLQEDLARSRVVRCLDTGLANLALKDEVDGDTTGHTDQLGHGRGSSGTGGGTELLECRGDRFLKMGCQWESRLRGKLYSQLDRPIG
jgi:hypothetical protein